MAAALVFALAAAGLTAATAPAGAVELDPLYCKALQTQLESAEKAGIRARIESGPEWAKANLTPKEIGEIGAFIALEEQVLFRCPVGFDNAVVAARNPDDTPPLPVRPPATLLAARAAPAAAPAAAAPPAPPVRAPDAPAARSGVPLPTRAPGQPPPGTSVRGWAKRAFVTD